MINIGERLPEATFKVRVEDGYGDVSTADVFGGKKVVLFAVPGAFTPTCTLNHLPGYLENRDVIMSKGVDAIAVISVNDHHVMNAWAKTSGGDGRIQFLADGNADFTKATGLELDMSRGGMGVRSKRYSMLVEDGIVTQLNIEDTPGTAVTSGASTILGQI